MTAEIFGERTIRYKTYAKQTLVDALTTVFAAHPDELLQHTKATIEFPKTEADYPSVVVRFFERAIFNAGVGHEERLSFTGESDSVEVSAQLLNSGSVQLTWPTVEHATGYKVYMGTAADREDRSFAVATNSFTDKGQRGNHEVVPTVVTASVDAPTVTAVAAPGGTLPIGTAFYRVTATTPSRVLKFRHYFYNADVEFAIYTLSAYDRDLVSDTLVQTIAMGVLEPYTSTFLNRVYPPSAVYPDSQLHFINLNTDKIETTNESQTQTPWGAEDDLIYSASYRVGVFGELYSLPPALTYAMIQRIALFPYQQGFDVPGSGIPSDDAPWVSNSVGA